MNRKEMFDGILRHAELNRANVGRFYDGLVELARRELARNKEFVLPGLGALRVRNRKARIGRNPQTGEAIQIPAKKVVRFRAYSSLGELLNGPPKASRPAPRQPEADRPSLWARREAPEASESPGAPQSAESAESPESP